GDLDGAVTAFQRAVELKPDFEEAHYNLGIALRGLGRTQAAQKELKEIGALREFRARLAQAKMLTLQGVAALKDKKLDEALTLFQKSIEKGPELPTGYYYSGVVLERKGDLEQALTAYQKALQLKPDYAQAHSSLGLLYWRQDDQTRGLEEFRQAVMCDPDLAEA